MEIKAGDTVEVVDIGGILYQHPTEERNIRNGDILHIKSVNGVHVYLDDKASGGDTGILAKRFKKVEEQPTVLVKNECTCPDLLNGHHNGCPYLRKD